MYSRQKIKMGNNLLDQSISQAKIILNEYDICDNCTGRLFAKKMGLSSNQLLGKKIKNRLNFKSSKICYICKEIHSHIQSIVDRMLAQSSDYSQRSSSREKWQRAAMARLSSSSSRGQRRPRRSRLRKCRSPLA